MLVHTIPQNRNNPTKIKDTLYIKHEIDRMASFTAALHEEFSRTKGSYKRVFGQDLSKNGIFHRAQGISVMCVISTREMPTKSEPWLKNTLQLFVISQKEPQSRRESPNVY